MKTLYVCSDYQKDLVNKNGKFYIQDAESIRGNIKKIIDHAKRNKIKVISTGDAHTTVSKEVSKFPDMVSTFPEHCMVGDEGMEFIHEIDKDYLIIDYTSDVFPINDVIKNNIILYKDHVNIFDENAGNPWALNTFLAFSPETVVVFGLNVDDLVAGLIEDMYTVVVIKDAVLGINKGWKDLGVRVIDTNTLIK